MAVAQGRKRMRTARVFHSAFGAGPYECAWHECDELVEKIGEGFGVIHHKDHVASHDVPENLVLMHPACHMKHHMHGAASPSIHWVGRHHTDEARAAISEKLTGRSIGEEHRQAIATGHQAPHVRAKMSSIQKGVPEKRKVCDDCHREWGGAWIVRHVKEGRCK